MVIIGQVIARQFLLQDLNHELKLFMIYVLDEYGKSHTKPQ